MQLHRGVLASCFGCYHSIFVQSTRRRFPRKLGFRYPLDSAQHARVVICIWHNFCVFHMLLIIFHVFFFGVNSTYVLLSSGWLLWKRSSKMRRRSSPRCPWGLTPSSGGQKPSRGSSASNSTIIMKWWVRAVPQAASLVSFCSWICACVCVRFL